MGPYFGRKHVAAYFTAVLLCCVWAHEEKVEEVKAREGASATLQTRKTTDIQILWTFGPTDPNKRIVNIKHNKVKSDYEEYFRDRLQVDSQTGTLTIVNLRLNDSGVYQWQSIGSTISSRRFLLAVYGSVSLPYIKVNMLSSNSNYGSLVVECSVENGRDLVLSWYRGKETLKYTSSPDLSARLSLLLEVEYDNEDNYSCVAENPFETQTATLHPADSCLKNGENSSWCQTEATVRLVISAVVGLALIILVVDHLRLRR